MPDEFRPLKSRVYWTDEQRRFVLKHHKEMSINALAKHFNRKITALETLMRSMGCSYFSDKE